MSLFTPSLPSFPVVIAGVSSVYFFKDYEPFGERNPFDLFYTSVCKLGLKNSI